MKRLVTLLIVLLVLVSCSSTKKAQRKARRADRLLKEAGMLAPSIMDTVFIVRRDTVVLTKDSIISNNQIILDTTKIDSLITELVNLKAKGEPENERAVRQLIYEEIVPDTTFHSTDSIKISIDNDVRYLRFSTDIVLKNGLLSVSVIPLDDIVYVSEKAVISVDARRKNFWQDWKLWLLIAIAGAVWFFRGILGATIKRF